MTTSLELLKEWAGGPADITDPVLQTLLDAHTAKVEVELVPDAGGLVFRSSFVGWLNATLTDQDGNELTPDTADLAAGRWTFAEDLTDLTVTATGTVSDVHAAAADAWTMRLAKANSWKGDFSKGARMMVSYHQARSFAHSAEGIRDDIRDGVAVYPSTGVVR